MLTSCAGQELAAGPQVAEVYRSDRATAFVGWAQATPMLALTSSRRSRKAQIRARVEARTLSDLEPPDTDSLRRYLHS